MEKVEINDGHRNRRYEVVESVTNEGYEYQGTCSSTDPFDEREYKIYRRKKDGVLVAVRGSVYG